MKCEQQEQQDRQLYSKCPSLIAHVIFNLDIGGLENGLINLINHMPKQFYRHAIICLKGYSDYSLGIRRNDVPIFALNKKEGKDLSIYYRLWRLFRKLKPDIVHTRNLGTIDSVIPAFLAGIRYRIHAEHGWDMVDLHGTNRKYIMLRRLCRPLIRHYIALSKDLETWLQQSIGVPGQLISQIYNGVDTGRFRPSKDKRERLPLPGFESSDNIVIGTIGRMSPVKDQLTLVRAFIELQKNIPTTKKKLRLALIGDGPLRKEAKILLSKANALEKAWLPGSRNDIPELLRSMDIFVLPSLNEGISNTILEAMATGLPIVATNVGGNPELVEEGRTGFLVPPSHPKALAKALKTYLEYPQTIHDHGKTGLTRIKNKFVLREMIRSYVAVYDGTIGVTRELKNC
jgi:sugar transferase (PEP-CTERM/EpsH1 system associated)